MLNIFLCDDEKKITDQLSKYIDDYYNNTSIEYKVNICNSGLELKELIEQKGGKVTGSVTGKTACLINNDVASNSSKNKKAKELGIPILSEADFLKRYEIDGPKPRVR